MTEEEGSEASIEYSATRWSGPEVFPVFGSASSSLTANERFESQSTLLVLMEMRDLKRETADARTEMLLDLALFTE